MSGLEPEAMGLAVNIAATTAAATSPATIAAISIAISLKRIADALEYEFEPLRHLQRHSSQHAEGAMTPATIVIRGCSIGDDVFSTDPAIFGVEITWNVTRIQRDADAGRFGAPETQPVCRPCRLSRAPMSIGTR